MSHEATNWALQQKGLKPASWIVLIHLADRHNRDTGQCNPSQARLAEDCGMPRSTLNRHLNELERQGLIKRIVTTHEQTKRQMPTSYVLTGVKGASVSQTETRKAVSQKPRKPCPKNEESRVPKWDRNPVREPKREPSAREAPALVPVPCDSRAADAWETWLALRMAPPLVALVEGGEFAGERVWLMPMRHPPDDSDETGTRIADRWLAERLAQHGQGGQVA